MEPKDRIVMPIYVTDEHGNKRQVDSLVFVRERTCKIIEWYEARDRYEIGNNRVRFSCGDFGTCHDKFCPECGARVVGE